MKAQEFINISDADTYAASVLPHLTVEEKVLLLSGVDLWRTYSIPRLGISAIKTSDGPVGVRGGLFNDGITSALLPSGVSLAATWNLEVIEEVGQVLVDQARSKEVDVVLGPTVCIPRTPLGGRNYETYSEDPLLNGKIAAKYINTLQESGVGACIKHFVANDQETDRFVVDEIISERALREIHLKPFEIAIRESNPWTVMTAYNKVNGVHCSAHFELLQNILRDEWEWNGLVMSDWFGTNTIVPSVQAGMDLEMPGPPRRRGQHLLNALKDGHIEGKSIDKCVLRVLRLLHQTGKSKIPAWVEGKEQPGDLPKHREILRKAAGEGVVLLKNSANLLPINLKKHKTIAFIGPNANVSISGGGGSSALAAHYSTIPFQSFQEAVQHDPTIKVKTTPGILSHCYVPLLDISITKEPRSGDPGYYMEFFANTTHSGEVVFNEHKNNSLLLCYDNLPPQLTTGERYSYRAMTSVKPKTTGRHQFSLSTCGPAKLYLDNKLLIEIERNLSSPKSSLFMSYGSPEEIVEIDMQADQTYNLLLESISREPYKQELSYFNEIRREEVMDGARIGFLEQVDEKLMFDEAITMAKESDLVVMVVGKNAEWEGETSDQVSMDLPGLSNELIRDVAKANKNTIVVNQTGSPIIMPWIDEVSAVIQAWYQGQEQGNAMADVLLGNLNPSGKLPVTFPIRLEDNPTFHNHPGENAKVVYGEGIFVGYRHYDTVKSTPLFPFGFGLSYTSFEYSNLRLSEDLFHSKSDTIRVSVDVTNTGNRQGKETVQFYVAQISKPGLRRPLKELKGWQKITLAPGETSTAHFVLDTTGLEYWDPSLHAFVMDSGAEFELQVGCHSRDVQLSARFYTASKL